MNLSEYQAKACIARYGVPVPKGEVASDPHCAPEIAAAIGLPVMVKAQVPFGGRGKAGGIRLARTLEEAKLASADLLSREIGGVQVHKVLIEQALEVQKEMYLSLSVVRDVARVVVVASEYGGVEIEQLARSFPAAIERLVVNPLVGLRDYAIRGLCKRIGLGRQHWQAFQAIVHGAYAAFRELDARLLEVNPLGMVGDGFVALDAKIVLDDNALFRHSDLAALRDPEGETPEEREARRHGMTYVPLGGEIGCIVNGAGLAMATADLVAHFGGRPANFLDIGGGASADVVAAALHLVLKCATVRVVLINIFGGITRCDEVARGIVTALADEPPRVPIVVRLVGTNESEGRAVLESASPHLAVVGAFEEAARMAVELAYGRC